MKNLPAGLQAHLDSGVTTLCWCWRLTRRDGAKLGFTDHDRDLVFDGTTFEAAAGFTASEIKDTVGLSVDNLEVESALTSDRLSEEHLAAGLYDDARVEIFRVNWQTPEQRVLMRSGSLGEVSRAGASFRAEVRWLARGLVTFASGVTAGRAIEVKRHTKRDGVVTIELWQEPVQPPLPGDTFSVTTGCDKHLATCRAKFSNTVNFRGFPHMPGNDFVTSYVRRDG